MNTPRAGIQLNTSDNIICFNEVFNNAGSGIFISAYDFSTAVQQNAINNQIYHNVFYANGIPGGNPEDPTQHGLGIMISEKNGQAVSDNLIANNIFFRNRGYAFVDGAIYSIAINAPLGCR